MIRYTEQVIYQNPTGKTEIIDSDGYHTGEHTITYGTEKTVMAFVSADANRAELRHFGVVEPFEKTCITNDKACDIEVGSLVAYGGEQWIVKKLIKAACLSYMGWCMDRVDIGDGTSDD